MSNRIYTTPKLRTSHTERVTAADTAETRQWDERLRRARLMKADADVARTAALLTADQPFAIRVRIAAEHQDNLLHRAELRTRYGIPTFTDQRVLAQAATRIALTTTAVTR